MLNFGWKRRPWESFNKSIWEIYTRIDSLEFTFHVHPKNSYNSLLLSITRTVRNYTFDDNAAPGLRSLNLLLSLDPGLRGQTLLYSSQLLFRASNFSSVHFSFLSFLFKNFSPVFLSSLYLISCKQHGVSSFLCNLRTECSSPTGGCLVRRVFQSRNEGLWRKN